jgi:hypothetical protein
MNTEPEVAATKPKLRWYQFSLAELVALTTLVAASLAMAKWLPWAASLVVSISVWIVAIHIDRRFSSHRPRREVRSYYDALLFFLLCGPFGAILWLAKRRSANADTTRTPFGYASPEDALADAFDLDMDGDWDAAVLLYAQIASRWPEHKQECRERLSQVEEKRLRVGKP